MLWLSLILFAFVLLLIRDSKVKKVNQFFNIEEVEAENFNAINVKSLVRKQNWQKLKESVSPTLMVLGPRSSLYIALYITGSIIASWYIVVELLSITNTWFVLGSSMVFTLCG
ncbi:type II secretion system protein F, partial [Vibrio breoganii]